MTVSRKRKPVGMVVCAVVCRYKPCCCDGRRVRHSLGGKNCKLKVYYKRWINGKLQSNVNAAQLSRRMNGALAAAAAARLYNVIEHENLRHASIIANF